MAPKRKLRSNATSSSSSTAPVNEEIDSTPKQSRVDDEAPPSKRRRRTATGLRQFSHRVCEKVQQRGTTSYNEVAKDLVEEFSKETKKDAKNIRRRVYDALNVLLAMDIITRQRKEITWKGYPADLNSERDRLLQEKQRIQEELNSRKKQLQEMQRQREGLDKLLERNTNHSSLQNTNEEHNRIHIPFIIVHTSRNTMIDCQMNVNATEVFFNFSGPFEIHNDTELIARIFLSSENQTPPINMIKNDKHTESTQKIEDATVEEGFKDSGANMMMSSNVPKSPSSPVVQNQFTSDLLFSPATGYNQQTPKRAPSDTVRLFPTPQHGSHGGVSDFSPSPHRTGITENANNHIDDVVFNDFDQSMNPASTSGGLDID